MKKILLLILTVFLSLTAVKAQEAYAVYTDDGTLTFYYDNQKSSRSGTKYGMNTGDNAPGWHYDHRTDIKKAVFDSSFAGARPTSTYRWFASTNYGSKFSEIIEIKYLNTSAVTNMGYMFSYCSGLTSLDVSHFDTSKVTSMIGMFEDCSGLTSLDVTHFDTSNVTDMRNMFSDCSGLTSLDVTHFDTSNVTNIGRMFNGCNGLTSLDVTHFDTSNVTSMGGMFYGCSGLTSLDVTHFNTSNVKNMNDMFRHCSRLTSIDVSHFDTSNVTYMSNMFYYCNSLTSLDVTHFDTSNVTDMSGIFYGCSGLTSLDVTHFDTSNVTNMVGMFRGCSGLTSLDVTHFDTSNVTNMDVMFYGCSGLTNLDVSHFDTSKVTEMASMFYGCSGLTSLDVTHFDTSNVTNMVGMFRGCSGLTSLDVSLFNTSKVTKIGGVFADCSGLTSLDVTHFNTSNVTDMSGIFYGCSGLTSLDLSHFDTSNVTTMGYNWVTGMFQGCTNLTTIYVGNGWNTDKVTDSDHMFLNCNKLVGGMGTKYDANHVDKEYAHIDGGPSNPGYLTGKNVSPEPDEEELVGWYTLIDKKMTLNGSPRGEYIILQSDGYLVWNNKADGNLTIKAYIDPDDAYILRFDGNPDNYLRISDIDGNTVTMVAENGITRIFTITEEQEEEPITGNSFKANTVEGIEMLFQIISEADKICQVGTGSEAAISLYTAGIVTIPSEARGYTVTKIANRAFKNCVQLTQVVIPNTITDIGTTEFQSAMGAFHDCKGIVSFDIPTSVTLIGRGTFSGCSTITELKIPESVTVIGSNAFDHCTGMKSIELSPFITAILLETFRDCTSLEYIEIPGSVCSIGYNAFQNCNALKGVTTYIEDPFTFPQSAFTNYSATLYVPAGTKEKYQSTTYWNRFYQIEEFDDAADALTFTTSKGLTYTVIHRGNTVSVKAASTDLSGEVTIPEVVMNNGKRYTVVTIKSGAFEGCSGLEKLKIAKTVTNIGAGAFIGCSNLTELDVTAGSPYTSIDGVLYSNYMTRLVAFPAGRGGEFELPKSVTSLADGAFAGCSKLTSLTAVQDNPIVLLANSGVFDGMDFDHCELHVPLGTAFKYRHAEGWKLFWHIVDDSEVEVDGMTYSVNPDGSVTLTGADDVLTSGDYVIPTEIVVDGVTYPVTGIADHAFEGCTGMTSLTIPEGITHIGDHAFAGCTGLEEIYCLSPVPIDLEAMFARSFWCTRRRVAETGPNQFEGVDFEHCVLYVPQGCVEAYRNAAGWSSFVNIVEMGGTGIRLTTTDGRQDGDAYTVSGIRVSHEQLHQGNQQKGIYIVNGRKVVVR